MKKSRLKRVELPDGRFIFCVHRDEVRAVRSQAQGYFAHGFEFHVGDVVFDVGANIGLFALEAAEKGATVHAFEPLPATFAALRANAKFLGDGKIHPHQLALGARRERAIFTYFPFLSTLSTRFPCSAKRNAHSAIESVFLNPKITPRATWFRRSPALLQRRFIDFLARVLFFSRRVVCQVETLSQQLERHRIERVSWLKIDVEGAEMDVLRGISDADWPKIERIVAEVHDENGRLDKMKNLLREQGFAQIWTEREPEAGQFDIYLLWARR